MPQQPARKARGPGATPVKERRARPDAQGRMPALQQLRGVLARPIGLERRDGKVKVVLVERRKAAPAAVAPTTADLCAELEARLLAHEPGRGSQSVRFLVAVHTALRRKDWAGVAALPSPVIAKASMLLKMMAAEDPSPLLDDMLERMVRLRVAAEQREDRDARAPEADFGRGVQVMESDFADFDDAERSWGGTVPDGLVKIDRDE